MKKVLSFNFLDLIKLIRIKQWVKNLFLFAPLIFSHHLFNIKYFLIELKAFISFCLISSIVYIINDIFDIEQDKKHPVKKNRPLASGRISIGWALFFASMLAIVLFLISYNLSPKFIVAMLTYLLINLFYSLRLKQIVLLDIFLIAFGFMIRIIAGGWVIDVYISNWLILCTLFLSLFLAISKRRSELALIQSNNMEDTRKVLSDYSTTFSDQISTIAAAGTVITYALYTVSERTKEIFHTENLIFTTPFVVFGIFRYIYLVHKKNLGENPTYIVTTDVPMIVNILLWLLFSVLIIYKQKLNIHLL